MYANSENPDHTSRSYASDLDLFIFTGHYAQVGYAMSQKFFNVTLYTEKETVRKDKIKPYVL